MSSSTRYPGLDHPTSSLRGPPSPSPPPSEPAESATATGDGAGRSERATGGAVTRSPPAKRRADGGGGGGGGGSGPSNSTHSPSTPADESSKRRRLAPSAASTTAGKDGGGPDGVDYDKPPISPVVLGFNLANTDPGMKDTVRSALRMKEDQQRLIQQRRVTGEPPSSSATSTPPHHPAKTEGEARPDHPPPPSVPSQADAMDVDGPASKDAHAPSLAVQGASPALGTGGFASGGLATRSHDEGRQKAGGLSIMTPANAEGGSQSAISPRGGPSPQPSARSAVVGLYPSPQGPGQTQPRSASTSSQPGSGPLSGRPTFPPTAGRPPHSAGYGGPSPSNNGGPSNGMSSIQHPTPSPAGYGPSSSSARAGPSHFAGAQQQRPLSPANIESQKTIFLNPFERFYDALVDSRTLQMTLTDMSMRTSELHRRGDEDLRRFNHTHSQAANLLNTLQASSTSLQDMVRKEVAVVREETRREVELVWKRIRQLEQGFTAAGLQIPPPLPAAASSIARTPTTTTTTTAAASSTTTRKVARLEDDEDDELEEEARTSSSEEGPGGGGGGPSTRGGRRSSARGGKAGGTGRGGAPAKAPKGTRGGGKIGA